MINFSIKRLSEDSPFYNLTFTKIVHKRTGEDAEESGDTLYGIPLDVVKNRIACENLARQDKDVTLQEYFILYHQSYKEVCELLKKTL